MVVLKSRFKILHDLRVFFRDPHGPPKDLPEARQFGGLCGFYKNEHAKCVKDIETRIYRR